MVTQCVIVQMFNEILAPNLSGDGTGCDNMTAILVNFNKSSNAAASVVESAK
jgi:serine/threonine protein phosphatase PrpC